MLPRFRFPAVLFVILAVTAAPALTCLSFIDQMSMQQMACCQHMNDECDMGVGQQSCCRQGNSQTLRAALPDKVVHVQPAMIAVHAVPETGQAPQSSHTVFTHADDGSPPLEPPGRITVLRI